LARAPLQHPLVSFNVLLSSMFCFIFHFGFAFCNVPQDHDLNMAVHWLLYVSILLSLRSHLFGWLQQCGRLLQRATNMPVQTGLVWGQV
jgi:hypothetical protein